MDPSVVIQALGGVSLPGPIPSSGQIFERLAHLSDLLGRSKLWSEYFRKGRQRRGLRVTQNDFSRTCNGHLVVEIKDLGRCEALSEMTGRQ